jgi:integrase
MARKRKLDPYTSIFVDRHGKERCRFRRRGMSCYLPHPSAKGYQEAYRRALQGLAPSEPRADPLTINDLLPRFYASVRFRQGGTDWQATRKRVLEAFRADYGSYLVSDFRPRHIDRILADKLEKRKDGKRTTGGTHAALRLREQLLLLFGFAVKQEWIQSNPVEQADQVEHKSEGFYPWSEDDIATFRDAYPLGTKPRLAMELILWTGARRGDAHKAAPPRDGRIAFRAGKTGKEQDVPVAPMLGAAIAAMPSVGLKTLLVTAYGKPFTAAGFGNWFGDKCRAAGLPRCTAHGLRKALARRAADRGVQQQGLKALGQWSNDREVATYVAGANQKRLAESALADVIAWEREANIV